MGLKQTSENKGIRDQYRGISKFKKNYQPKTNMIKDENGYQLADSHSILSRWKNYFFQVPKVHGVNVW
jgi:hypothetical protein